MDDVKAIGTRAANSFPLAMFLLACGFTPLPMAQRVALACIGSGFSGFSAFCQLHIWTRFPN